LVHLKNGRVLSGEVIQDDGQVVVIRLPYGTVQLRADQVDFIERQTPAQYRLDLGRDYLNLRQYEPALEALEQAQTLAPDAPEVKAALRQTYAAYAAQLVENRRLAEARACLAKWLALDPESQPARGQLAAVQAGAAQLERLLAEARAASNALDTEGAIRKYEAVLQFTPDARGKAGPELAAVLARRALQRYQGRRFADAAGDLERAFSLDPALATRLENLYVASALSDVRLHLRELSAEQARERYARILAFAPTHPGLLYAAARLEEVSSNLPAAADLYARALGVRVSHPSAERVAELRRDLEKALGLKEAEGGVAVQPADDARYAQADPGNFQSLDLDRFTILHHQGCMGLLLDNKGVTLYRSGGIHLVFLYNNFHP
jgi:tetratricopeptide (TPR) repeat protein